MKRRFRYTNYREVSSRQKQHFQLVHFCANVSNNKFDYNEVYINSEFCYVLVHYSMLHYAGKDSSTFHKLYLKE